MCCLLFFFFNDTATTEIYTLSLHDALPISLRRALRGQASDGGVGRAPQGCRALGGAGQLGRLRRRRQRGGAGSKHGRSEEHTSELQSRQYLVCRLLLEKKKKRR